MNARPASIDATERRLARAWARLGVLFNVEPAPRTPDVERLFLDTARFAARNTRLLVLAATWLAAYPDYLAKRRLAVLVRDELEPSFRPVMGFLIAWATEHGQRNRHRFQDTLALCHPAEHAGPLPAVFRESPALAKAARRLASALSKRWGVWMEPFSPKNNALRPAEWIARHNPRLALRALVGGDLVATIAADAASGLTEYASESLMARRYDASRAALREALRKMKMAGLVTQRDCGRSRTVHVRAA